MTKLHRFRILVLFVVVMSSVVLWRGGQVHAKSPIQHIVFIMKENHTFDSYFGSFPNVNGATTGLVKVNGVDQTIPLNPALDISAGYCHQFGCAHTDYDKGAMDAFNLGDRTNCGSPPYLCYQVGSQSFIPNYWNLAQNYVLGDNAFSSLEGPSFPNHLYMVAAGSGPDINHSVIGNPGPGNWGCDGPSNDQVLLYNKTKVFPCFTFSTLADEMTMANVSWKYYAPGQGQGGYIWSSLDAFSSIRNTSLWASNVVNWTTFAKDAHNGNLPAFSWVTPPWIDSEHNTTSTCVGENWTIQLINAVMSGPDWASTAIVVSWDDFGGYYDHVPPQQVDALGYGFRVPLLVISPYAYVTGNPADPHVDHTSLEFSSVLSFAETVFNIPSLGRRDTTAGNLMSALDFSQVHEGTDILPTRTCTGVGAPPPAVIDD